MDVKKLYIGLIILYLIGSVTGYQIYGKVLYNSNPQADARVEAYKDSTLLGYDYTNPNGDYIITIDDSQLNDGDIILLVATYSNLIGYNNALINKSQGSSNVNINLYPSSTTTTTTTTTTSTTLPHITVSPASLDVSLYSGETTSRTLLITNIGNIIVINPSSDLGWISFSPQSFVINPNEQKQLTVNIEVPEDADEGDYTGNIYLSGYAIVPITIHVLKQYYTIIDSEWFSEGEEINIEDYTIKIVRVSSVYAKIRVEEDGEEIDTKKCYEDEETKIGNFKIIVEKLDSDEDKVRLTIKATEEYEVFENFYQYTLFENEEIKTGTWLDFNYGSFYIYLNSVADTGARIDYYPTPSTTPHVVTCFINEDCKIGNDILLTIHDINRINYAGAGSIICDLKSKKQYLVYKTNVKPTEISTQQQPSNSGKIYISIAAGRIAPGAKVIFYVRDYENNPIRTGTLTIDLPEPITVDIFEGLATVRFPETIECPLLVTASAPGYQISPQVFSCEVGELYSSKMKGNCSDGQKNCHHGKCEVGVDCGGPCEPCKFSMEISPTNPTKNETVTITVKFEDEPLDDVTITVTKPSGNTLTLTTEDGKAEFEVDEDGTYTIKAEKEDFKTVTKEIKTREKKLTIVVSPPNPKIGDTVMVVVRDERGAIIKDATVTINGATYSPDKSGIIRFQITQKSYTISASKPGYASVSKTITIAPPTTIAQQAGGNIDWWWWGIGLLLIGGIIYMAKKSYKPLEKGEEIPKKSLQTLDEIKDKIDIEPHFPEK